MLYAIDYMQQMTPEMCEELPTPTAATTAIGIDSEALFENTQSRGDGTSTLIPQVYLRDKRDEKSYVVRKLADGNCWMAQNLAIFGGSEISPSLSNTSFSYILPESSTSGLGSSYSPLMYNGSHIDSNISSTGSYYNWCAVTLNTCENYTRSGQTALNDICPKNWRLPTGGISSGEFADLYASYNKNVSNMITAAGLYLHGGGYGNGWAPGDTYGTWWSSTADDGRKAFMDLIYTNGNNQLYSMPYYFGYSVRCVAKNVNW